MKWRGIRQKSKKSKKPCQNGRRSRVEAGRSPKEARNRIRLDVKATKEQAEVQSGREIPTDWTLKPRGSSQKSKRSKKPRQNGHRSRCSHGKSPPTPRKIPTLHTKSSPPPELPTTIISSPSYPSSISSTCREYVKRYEEATGADRLHILNRTIEEIRKKTYMK